MKRLDGLLAVVTGGTRGIGLACVRPDLLQPATQRLPPRYLVMAALFLMAWSLESRSLFQSLLRPLPALWAGSISYSALPALAWSVGWLGNNFGTAQIIYHWDGVSWTQTAAGALSWPPRCRRRPGSSITPIPTC